MSEAILSAGKTAPAFTLHNQNNQEISLKDFKGKSKVLLYFYPKAMTPGCTVQACGLSDGLNSLKSLGVEVLGISTDSVARLKKFQEKENLNFTLLSDEDHQVAEKYGVWGLKKMAGREYMGLKRVSFLIGIDGKIEAVMAKVNTKSHFDDVMELLK